MSKKWLQRALSILGLGLLAASGWFLYHELHTLNVHKVLADIAHRSPGRILITVALVVLAYIVILGYDFLALEFIGVTLSRGRVVFASFVSSAFSNAISLPVLGVGGTRLRIYQQWNVPAGDIAYLISFIGLSNWMGLLTLAGISCVLAPPHLPTSSRLPDLVIRVFGGLFLAAVAAAFALCATKSHVRLGRWSIRLPPLRLCLGQWAVGIADWTFQACVFYAVLNLPHLSLRLFLPTYFAAMLMAMFAHLPAGLGVFDVGILVMLSPFAHTEQLVSALVLYRLFYHLGPLVVATALFAGHELMTRFANDDQPESSATL